MAQRDEIKALRDEIAKLREEIAGLRAGGVHHHYHYPSAPRPQPNPRQPYAPYPPYRITCGPLNISTALSPNLSTQWRTF